ncbi:MAG: hypothetical protein EA352_11385 [Gemmatimonadales bacterium]|nr:MAG: hypothetical protein EA352_11385 [Gemmatimonadales bacterium]
MDDLTMDEPWIVFTEELRERADEIPEDASREDDLAEALHEAGEAAAARLHAQADWEEEDAAEITGEFIRLAGEWIAEGIFDWDDLRERLELAQQEWDSEFGASPI